MTKTRIKRIFFIIGDHLLFAVVMLLMVTSIFSFMFKNRTMGLIGSGITALLYLSSVYSYSWNNAGRDYRRYVSAKKRAVDEDIKFNIYEGFIDSAGLLALNTILLILAFACGPVCQVIFRTFNFSFLEFIINTKNNLSVFGCIVAVLLPFAASGFGYMAGKKGISITQTFITKYVYKKKNDNNNK